MKSFVMMMISAILGGITLMIAMTIDGRSNRSMELQGNLPSAVEETVEIMAVDQKYSINNPNEYLADFIENLSVLLDSNSGIKVEILNTDKEKGLLSIRVTEEFEHPNGKAGTVECERTVILNKVARANQEIYTVKFFLKKDDIVNGKPYKVCRVCNGDAVSIPVEPTSTDGTFAGWLDPNDYAADFTVPVTGDITYYAAWN